MTKQEYEQEAALRLQLASVAMKKEIPNYGEAEHQISGAQEAIKYARQINNREYRGEKY